MDNISKDKSYSSYINRKKPTEVEKVVYGLTGPKHKVSKPILNSIDYFITKMDKKLGRRC